MGIKIRAYPYIAACEAFLKSIKPLIFASNYSLTLRIYILGLEIWFLLKMLYTVLFNKYILPRREEKMLRLIHARKSPGS